MIRAGDIRGGRAVPLDGPWPQFPRLPGGVLVGLRLVSFLIWTLLCAIPQAVLIFLPGRAKARLPRLYWAGCCRCLGLRVRVIGERAGGSLPVVYVGNHSSWMDIPALGAVLTACFIAKGEVGQWPVVSIIARLGRTLFVSRKVATAAKENADILNRLRHGDSLILFPEGTTSDGTRVMPFRSAFLAITETELPHVLQPFSVIYDELDFLPVRRQDRALFAWFGDMELASHFNRIARHRGLRVTIQLHPPLDAKAERLNRKQLAQLTWAQVAEGAAEIRRNRNSLPG